MTAADAKNKVVVAEEEPAGGSRDSPESVRRTSRTNLVRQCKSLASRRSGERWVGRFLQCLRDSPNVSAACAAVQISRTKAYRVREQDADFAEAWQEALDASLDELEATAFKRAKEGDSSLITWLLRCHRPERYREVARSEHAVLGRIVLIPAKAEGDE